MKTEDFMNLVTTIDDDIINDAWEYYEKTARSRVIRRRAIVLAAAVLAVIAVVMIPLFVIMNRSSETPFPTSTAPASDHPIQTNPTESATIPASDCAAFLYLDINPGVRLSILDDMTILECEGINVDGNKLLSDESFTDLSVDDAIRKLVTLCADKGYLTQEQNEVLLAVTGEDQVFTNLLCICAERAAKSAIAGHVSDGVVVAQTVTMSDEIKELCRDNDLTPGKAVYILNILALTDNYSVQALAKMSFAQLRHIAEQEGVPSEKIGVEKAIALAVEHFTAEYYPADDWMPFITYVPLPDDQTVRIRALRLENTHVSKIDDRMVEIYVIEDVQANGPALTGYTINFKDSDRIYQYVVDWFTGNVLRQTSFEVELTNEEIIEVGFSIYGINKGDGVWRFAAKECDGAVLTYCQRISDGKTYCVIFVKDGGFSFCSCVIPDVPFPADEINVKVFY